MLYLIKSGKYSKIGYTENFKERYKQYITCNPDVTVLGLREGNKFLESKYHQIFAKRFHRNEWFIVPDKILNYLQTHQFTIKFIPPETQNKARNYKVPKEERLLEYYNSLTSKQRETLLLLVKTRKMREYLKAYSSPAIDESPNIVINRI